MPNVLIRDVDAEVLNRLDAQAERLGLSRSDYLRRTLTSQSRVGMQNTSIDDLRKFSQMCAGLADEELMAQAWN